MASTGSKKSTNVRVMRRAFRVAEVIAPGLAARAATRLWFSLPAGPSPVPLPRGGTSFEVVSQGRTVRGLHWGSGSVVYLVHGWAGRGSQLAAFVEPLVRRGHRVVMFDALSHGDSDPGPSGSGSSNGMELGRALDAVAARFGPARAVVAHSMGAVSTMLALRYGWLGTQRLLLLAPMSRYASQFDVFAGYLGLGPRTRRRVDQRVAERVGLPTERFDVAVLAAEVEPVPTLVVHDRSDRQTSYDESVRLVDVLPDARMLSTQGLGHRRVLSDPGVVETVASFADGSDLVTEMATPA